MRAKTICISVISPPVDAIRNLCTKIERNENIGGNAPLRLPARFSISQVRDRITGKTAQDDVRRRSLIKMWGSL